MPEKDNKHGQGSQSSVLKKYGGQVSNSKTQNLKPSPGGSKPKPVTKTEPKTEPKEG